MKLASDNEPIVRAAAIWAIGEMAAEAEITPALAMLQWQLAREDDEEVRDELQFALSRFSLPQ